MILWLRTWQLGIKSLLLHPMRSLLTVLGIFIGVASVIWLLAIGEGISREAQRQIEGLGAENIIVRSIKPPSETNSTSRGPVAYGVKRSEHEKLVETIPTIVKALPIREVRRQISYGTKAKDGRLVGCTPDYDEFTKLVIDRGRFIEDADVKHLNNNCVLAARLALELFTYEDPLGKRAKKPAGSADGTGRKKVFGLNASAFIQRKMAEQQAKADEKEGKK